MQYFKTKNDFANWLSNQTLSVASKAKQWVFQKEQVHNNLIEQQLNEDLKTELIVPEESMFLLDAVFTHTLRSNSAVWEFAEEMMKDKLEERSDVDTISSLGVFKGKQPLLRVGYSRAIVVCDKVHVFGMKPGDDKMIWDEIGIYTKKEWKELQKALKHPHRYSKNPFDFWDWRLYNYEIRIEVSYKKKPAFVIREEMIKEVMLFPE